MGRWVGRKAEEAWNFLVPEGRFSGRQEVDRDFAFKKKLPILPIVYEAKRGITMRNKNYSFFMYKQSKRTPFRV